MEWKVFTEGDVVLYVPSHDAEYNHQPAIGKVLSVYDESIEVETKAGSLGVKKRFAAHLGNIQEILSLIITLNNEWLECMSTLYVIGLKNDQGYFQRVRNMIREYFRSHYHKN